MARGHAPPSGARSLTLRAALELAVSGAAAVLLAAAALSPATGSAAAPPQTSAAPRGAVLFAAKGCVGCHTHAAFPGAHMQVGPDLTDLRARASGRVAGMTAEGYVRQSLRSPSAFVVPGYTTVAMPDLHLTDPEIEALAAFLLWRD